MKKGDKKPKRAFIGADHTRKLPNLPRGQGTFAWVDGRQETMRYDRRYKAKADGKTYRLTATGKTSKECFDKMDAKIEAKEKELEAKIKVSLENPNVTLANAMIDWLLNKKAPSKKARTIDRDEVTIKNQIDGYEIGQTPVVNITPNQIEEHIFFLQYKAEHKGQKGYSFSTVKKTYELLDQFFRYAYKESPGHNPMKKTTKPTNKGGSGEVSPNNKPDTELTDIVLSDDEIFIFKRFALEEPKEKKYGQSKYGAALYFILHTFLRAGEAMALKWQDVDFENKLITISKTVSRVKDRDTDNGERKTKIVTTTPKTETGKRYVMLSDEALEALIIIRERSSFTAPQDYVIATSNGKHVSEDRLYLATRNLLDLSGLMNEARKETFGVHYLRHTGISYYLRHGVPVEVISKMAGHSSVAVTSKFYYHVIHNQSESALELMNLINAKYRETIS